MNYGTNNNFNPFNQPNLGSYGYYADFGRPDVQQWWGQQYAYLIQTLGLDMIWQDMTCPAMTNGDANTFPLGLMVSFFGQYVEAAKNHNSYVLNLLKATFQGLAALRPSQRNFIIARGGFAGMQRYAGTLDRRLRFGLELPADQHSRSPQPGSLRDSHFRLRHRRLCQRDHTRRHHAAAPFSLAHSAARSPRASPTTNCSRAG